MLKKLLLALAMFHAALSFAAVDVNKASAAQLDGVKGIGPAKAGAKEEPKKAFLLAQAATGGPSELTINKLNSGNVRLSWAGSSGNGRDWVSVVPAGTPDNSFPEDKTMWRYTGWTSGTILFGPLKPGAWEGRFYLDDGYVVAKRVSFSIP